MASDALRRIDAVIQVGMKLARSAPSGRVALARIAATIELDWIPQPWGDDLIAELERARGAACEPLDFSRVERVLRDAWGTAPADELDELDAEPAAVTPGAQVHRGVIDGIPVAVKVLRPGLGKSVRQDLALLEGLVAPLGAAFPALDARAVVHEARQRIDEELDLEHEGTMQRRFHRALRRHPLLMVPAPVSRLTHEEVMVSEWVEGVPLREAPDPDRAAAALVLFAFGAARFGVIHADLTPDDVIVLDDGRLAILDFGATRGIDRGRVHAMADAVEAFAQRDQTAFGRALERLGALPASHADTADRLVRHALGPLAESGSSRLDSDAVIAARDRLFERTDDLIELILAGTLPPEDLWPARGAGQLFATIARAGASGPWLELTRSALRDGWDAELP